MKKNNYARYDRIIRARIDMSYDKIDFESANNVVHFCRQWKQHYLAECFFYGNREYVEMIVKNYLIEYGKFIDESEVDNVTALTDWNMGHIVELLHIPINFIDYTPGTNANAGYKLFNLPPLEKYEE